MPFKKAIRNMPTKCRCQNVSRLEIIPPELSHQTFKRKPLRIYTSSGLLAKDSKDKEGERLGVLTVQPFTRI